MFLSFNFENIESDETIYIVFDCLEPRFEKRVLNAAEDRTPCERICNNFLCVQVLAPSSGNAAACAADIVFDEFS